MADDTRNPYAAHVHEWDTDSDEFSTFTPDPALYEDPWVIHECLTVGCLAIKVTRVLRDQPVEIIYEEATHAGDLVSAERPAERRWC